MFLYIEIRTGNPLDGNIPPPLHVKNFPYLQIPPLACILRCREGSSIIIVPGVQISKEPVWEETYQGKILFTKNSIFFLQFL